MTTPGAKLLKSTVVHVFFAFVAMGGWGIVANATHPMPEPLIAGLAQGIISAILTLLLKRTVDWMRPRFSYPVGYWAPPLIASLVSAVVLIGGHLIARTPEILTTIAVPITVSATYIFTYNVLRQRKG